MAHTVYIALGSNLGDRLRNLRLAVDALSHLLKDVRTSIVLKTEALLLPGSPKEWNLSYYNMIVCGQTDLSPLALLEQLQAIEVKLGRVKEHPQWGPRTIDLDILLYDDLILNTEILKIPHVELKNRDFLLHLMSLVSPDLKYPKSDLSFEALAREKLKETGTGFHKTFTLHPQLVGIVNVTPDSFSDGGDYFNPEAAVQHCYELIEAGASVLDLGAQSTRPGAHLLTIEEEWQRLEPVLAQLDFEKIAISIDTYQDAIVERLLKQFPIAWINDVSGRLQASTLRLIADSGCKLCTMHALHVPPVSGEYLENPLQSLKEWCEQQIEQLTHCGFTLKNIILDPGIGFGKSPYQTGLLIQKMDDLRQLGCELLVGHSRKSYLNLLGEREAKDRDIETLAISASLKDKVDYLRVHNVALHQRFFTTQHWIENCHES
ncbi:MAG: dihydropteroate synthase [Opitutales bacterium]